MNTTLFFTKHPQISPVWQQIQAKLTHIPTERIQVVENFINCCEFRKFTKEQLGIFLKKLIEATEEYPIVERLLIQSAKADKIEGVVISLAPDDGLASHSLNPENNAVYPHSEIKLAQPDIIGEFCHELKHTVWGASGYRMPSITADGPLLAMLDEAEAKGYNDTINQSFPAYETIAKYSKIHWMTNQENYHAFLKKNGIDTSLAALPRMKRLYAECVQMAVFRDFLMSNGTPQAITAISKKYGISLSSEEVQAIQKSIKIWQALYRHEGRRNVLGPARLNQKVVALHKERSFQESGNSFDLTDSMHFFTSFLEEQIKQEKAHEEAIKDPDSFIQFSNPWRYRIPDELNEIADNFDWENPIHVSERYSCMISATDQTIKNPDPFCKDIEAHQGDVIVTGEQFLRTLTPQEFETEFERYSESTCAHRTPRTRREHLYIQVTCDIFENGELAYKKGDYVRISDTVTWQTNYLSFEPVEQNIYQLTSASFEELAAQYALYDWKNELINKGPAELNRVCSKGPQYITGYKGIRIPQEREDVVTTITYLDKSNKRV